MFNLSISFCFRIILELSTLYAKDNRLKTVRNPNKNHIRFYPKTVICGW